VYKESIAFSKNLAAILLLDSIERAALSLSLVRLDNLALYTVPPFLSILVPEPNIP
jgi:hypothetical protein